MIQTDHVWRSRRRWMKRGAIRQAVEYAVLAGLLAYLASWAPGASRRWLSQALAPDLSHEAKRLALTYKDATDRPDWVKGRPVRWFVTHRGDGYYYGDNQALPVRWEGAPPEIAQGDKRGDGAFVIGLVEDAGPKGVTLTYKSSEQ